MSDPKVKNVEEILPRFKYYELRGLGVTLLRVK